MSKVLLKKIGTEFVLSIPSDLIDEVGAKEGDVLDLHINAEKKLELGKSDKADRQVEALAMHEELMNEYASTFERLAK